MTYIYCIRKGTIHEEQRKSYTLYGINAVNTHVEILSGFSDNCS